jgi:hypothetical protein
MPLNREELMAMTTNERLFEAGLIDSFDRAVEDRNEMKIREILKSVFVDEASIELIIEGVHRGR